MKYDIIKSSSTGTFLEKLEKADPFKVIDFAVTRDGYFALIIKKQDKPMKVDYFRQLQQRR